MTTTLTVTAHKLRFSDQEGERKVILAVLEDAENEIVRNPRSLGSYFNDALRLLGFCQVLDRPHSELLEALELARDCAVGLFLRGNVDSKHTVSFDVRGQRVEVPGGTHSSNSAPRWLDSFGVASVLRDVAALDALCNYNPLNFERRAGYDTYLFSLACAQRALHRGDDDIDLWLDKAVEENRNATVIPSWAKSVGRPLIELTRIVAHEDWARFDEVLVTSLEGWREGHKIPSQAERGEGMVAVIHLGLCARAHDRGMPIGVKSDYIPAWLIAGDWPQKSS